MAVKPFEIKDFKSFDTTTNEPHQLAGLYFFYKLDFLIELAHQVTLDFFNRPGLFTDLSGTTLAPILAQLHARYGSHEEFLDCKQRYAIFSALFGNNLDTPVDEFSHETCNFHCLSRELMDACALFVETKFGDAESLRDAVRQSQSNFQQYLTGLHGDSIRWSMEGALSHLTEQSAYPIFRNKGISARYGIGKNPTDNWPYVPDANGAKLIEAISKALDWPDSDSEKYRHINNDILRMPYISFDLITNEQQVALKGTRAIATAIEVDPNGDPKDIDKLINRVYTWAKAAQKVKDYSKMYRRHTKAASNGLPRGGIALAQPMAASKESKEASG